jgi:YfiH family protein
MILKVNFLMSTTTKNLFIQPEWPAPQSVHAFTTLRASNVGNLPNKQIDKPLLKNLLQLPNDPIWVKQTHSDIALKAELTNKNCEADATFTDEPNQVCAILTADCLPLLICDVQGNHVAAIHAGWKGLAKGIIENTVRALNLNPDDLLVWLGPAIGPSKFEIREDVYQALTQGEEDAKACFTKINSEQWLANLYALAKVRLNRLGVSKIYGGNFCTHTQTDQFFSYRRDGQEAGRIISLIWLADNP